MIEYTSIQRDFAPVTLSKEWGRCQSNNIPIERKAGKGERRKEGGERRMDDCGWWSFFSVFGSRTVSTVCAHSHARLIFRLPPLTHLDAVLATFLSISTSHKSLTVPEWMVSQINQMQAPQPHTRHEVRVHRHKRQCQQMVGDILAVSLCCPNTPAHSRKCLLPKHFR